MIFLLLVGVGDVFGQSGVYYVPSDFQASNNLEPLRLTDHLMYYQDKSGELTFEQIRDRLWNNEFVPLGEKKFHRDSLYWVFVELRSKDSAAPDYWISTGDFHWVEVFVPQAEDSWEVKKKGKKDWPVDPSIIYDHHVFTEVDVVLQEGRGIYFKVLPGNNRQYSGFWVSLHNPGPIQQLMTQGQDKNLFFLAVFVSMLVYNLSLFLISKERTYLDYLVFISLCALVLIGYRYGPYFLPQFVKVGVSMTIFNLTWISFINFSQRFLDQGEADSRKDQLGKAMKGVLLMFAAYYTFSTVLGSAPYISAITSIDFLLGIYVLLSLSRQTFKSYQRGFQPALYLLLANSVFIVCSVLTMGTEVLRWNGLLPFNHIVVRENNMTIAMVGIGSQMMLYGFAVGHKILRLQKERAEAVEEKLQTQQTINLQLEEKVTERTSQLEHRNRENELLLGEIHHRVKNNLQVISSLLKLQSRQLDDGKAKNAVLEGRDRVKAMALIHQRLYQQDRFSAIEMHDYVLNLVENLAQSYGFAKSNFRLDLEVPELHLDVDSAIPIGLIINELVSNAFKHAFQPDRDNQLTIRLQEEVNTLTLQVKDNGQGINTNDHQANSFGLQLIGALTEELKGQVIYENGKGTSVQISISEYKVMSTI